MTAVLIVEDGHSPYVLAAVRSLGRAGFRVGLASPEPNPKVAPSRWASAWHPARLPERDLDGFVTDVQAALAAGRYDLVFGADDIELLALSSRRSELAAVFPHSSHASVLRSVDKLSLTEAAQSVGMAVPRTEPATPAALDAVTGPVVVKSRLHWTPGSGGSADRHLLVALSPDADDARARVRRMAASGGQAVLQEPITGEQIALSVVVDRSGAVVAASQQRTLLSSLARTSVRAETLAVDADLLELVRRLLLELDWFGLANLQFLVPPQGRPHLIDLNGRFYGSLALAVAAGADLPAIWARAALGQPAAPGQPLVQARPGVRFHALHTDLVRARVQRRGGLAQDLLDTARFAPGAAHSTWCRQDPRPAAMVLRQMAAAAGQRLRPRAVGA